jgi:5-methylcytosine-specific restriction enzyme subunit McrC
VGIAQIGNVRFEVLPKLYEFEETNDEIIKKARRNLFKLLSIAGLVPIKSSALTRYSDTNDLYEFLVSLFLDDLETVFSGHVHSEYVPIEADLKTVRGKLNIQRESLKPPNMRHIFYCSYDEFSIDNPLNIIIKTTLRKLAETCIAEDNRKRSRDFCSLLEEVRDEAVTNQTFERVRISRLSMHYKNIINTCYLFLFGNCYSMEPDNWSFHAILFDMNLVFERYVAKLIRGAIPQYGIELQKEIFLSSSGGGLQRDSFGVKPDIIIYKEGRKSAILDSKYKLDAEKGMIGPGDMYQMIAYGVAAEVDNVVLIYPKSALNDQRLDCLSHTVVLNKVMLDNEVRRRVRVSAFALDMFDNGRVRGSMSVADQTQLFALIDQN